MTDIEIRRGGLVAVDTAELRAAADGLEVARHELSAAAEDLASIEHALSVVFGPTRSDAVWQLSRLRGRIDASAERARQLAVDLRTAADIAELIEVRAELAIAGAAGDRTAVDRLTRTLRTLSIANPAAAADAAGQESGWHLRRMLGPALATVFDPARLRFGPDLSGGLVPLLTDPGAFLVGYAALAGAVGGAGRVVPTPLRGPTDASSIRLDRSPAVVSAPASLADMLARVPSGATASRVRVDRFAMPDGSARFAVYVSGTRSVAGPDPWNMPSNLQLYTGGSSASLEAVRSALDAAGAREGDVVVPVGQSQGAMIASAIAHDGTFEVPAVIVAGSPTEVDPGPDAMRVELRHTDDPIAALSSRGDPGGTGSPESIVVEREADPARGWGDLAIPAHHLDAYVETAAAVDAADDPRVGPVRDLLADLATATEVRSTVYAPVLTASATAGG